MAAPTIVQSAIANGPNKSICVLAAPATPGNILIGVVWDRDWGGSGYEPPPHGGFTQIASAVDAISFDRAATVVYHVVEADESPYTSGGDGVSYALTPSTTQYTGLWEIDGSYDGVFAKRDSVGSTTAMNAGGAVTPAAGDDVLIMGFAVMYTNVSTAEDGNTTERRDFWSGFSPRQWAGSREVLAASGAYSVGGTLSGASHWAGVTIALTGAPTVVNDFEGSPRTGSAPLAVSFEATTPGASSWLWDFGDGTTSTLENPDHVYSAVGTYDVSLTIDGTTTITKAGYIVVRPALAFEVYEVVPPGDSLEFVGTLSTARDKAIRPVRNQPGTGQFTINRYSAEATAAILKPGNLVRTIIPTIDPGAIYGWFMEDGDFALVDRAEKGGEVIKIGGRGLLSYWERAVWLSERFVIPWWDAGWGTPPVGARGHVTFAAGTYRHYTIAGGVITGYTNFTTSGFEAYFDTRQTYDWPSANSKRFLVHLMAGETHAGWYVHPHQDGVVETLPSQTVGTSSTVLLSDISPDTPGAILYHLYLEGTDPARPVHPIPLMTIDFTATHDSNGDPWATTDALAGLTAELGDTYLDTIALLLSTGVIDVEMGPNLDMHAYNSQGRDLTGTTFGAGKVRFVKGVNIKDELHRQRQDNPVATFAQVVGTDNVTANAVLPDAATRVAREVGITGDSADPAVLEALGLADLQARLVASDAIGFRVTAGNDEDHGLYLPGPEGTANGKYWLGDTTTLHTGTGEQDFDQADERVYAITIELGDAGVLQVTPEVGSVLGEAERQLYAKGDATRSASTSFVERSQFNDTQVAEQAHPDLAVHDDLGLATQAELDAVESAAAAALSAHVGDTVDAHDASAISFAPTGTVAATDVQAAIAEVAAESLSNPMTTPADLIVGGTSGAPTRLAKGSDGQVLTVDPTTHLLVWATPSSGFADPMTTRGDLIYRGGSGTTRRAVGSAGQALVSDGTDPVYADQVVDIVATVDGGGSVIATGGPKGFLRIDFACTIVAWDLEGDVSTTSTMDIKKRASGGGAASSITGSAKPATSAATEASSSTLTGWTTTIAAGDKLYWHVDANNNAKILTLTLKVTRA